MTRPYRARNDPDNISIISATSLAPSYHSTLPRNETTLIAPHYRSYLSRPRSQSTDEPSLNVYSIPGFRTFNVQRNDTALERVAARRFSNQLDQTLAQFAVNHEREQLTRGSSSHHPMSAHKRPVVSHTSSLESIDEQRCPLEKDNEVWDYGFMCNGSYPSLEYYQRRARELTHYEEREAMIKSAHQRLCCER